MPEQTKFDLEKVKNEIMLKVFGKKETISMANLHQLYNDGHADDHRYRGKLKAKLIETYGNRIRFLQHDKNIPDSVTINYGSSEYLKESFDKKTIISTASRLVREDIIEYAKKSNVDNWPPNLTVLKSLFEAIPKSVIQFLETLLKDPAHGSSERIQRLIRSFSCDLVHGVTAGKILTLKHYLVGLGFHNMGGQKLLVQILNLLGHSVSYDTIRSSETALAELNQLQSEMGASCGLYPKSNDGFVHTYFWADNFNKKVEGKNTSMIDSTHMIKFQERHNESLYQNIIFQKLEKSRSKFQPRKPAEIQDLVVKKKPNPMIFKSFDKTSIDPGSRSEVSIYLVWVILRVLTQSEKLLPNFAGWRLAVRKFKRYNVEKTVITYLPPINASVNDFTTIYQYLSYMQKLSFEANMPYVNVTLDCGAAVNAYKLIWNYPTVFDNVIVHLGDFHFMKEIFVVLGKLVKGSGFEDIVFQSNLSSSGSLNGVINGSHYNRCWSVHEHFAEALEILLYERYLIESSLPTQHIENSHVTAACEGNDSLLLNDPVLRENVLSYSKFKQSARDGNLGKTPQFWTLNYLDIMETLHQLHIAVQESDFDERLRAYLQMMPYICKLNLVNYLRYGSFYICQMLNMEELFPGNKEILKTYGISVQGQDKYPLRTAIDQRGEQTLNRDAKMPGGITGFATDDATVSKWTLNRSSVAEITEELKVFSGAKKSDDIYKPTRPNEIVKSNNLTLAVINVLRNEYINPFDKDLNPSKLYNLSSGIPVEETLAKGILGLFKEGLQNFHAFINERLTSKAKAFFSTIPKLKVQLFSDSSKKVEVAVNGKSKTIEANSNIISKLLALSSKLNRTIDMKSSLCFPLCFTPLNLAHSDGARRKTNKSDLTHILLHNCSQESNYPQKQDVIAYIVDLMAMINARPCTPDTFIDFVLALLDMIPSGYRRVDIVADTYRKHSIKDPERASRGCAEKILVKSPSSKLPRNFGEFLQNGENKTRLIEIICDVLISERENILAKLKCDILFYSMDGKCLAFSRNEVQQSYELSSNQEEADTKIILHCRHAFLSGEEGSVIIRSHSGDADVNILSTALITEEALRTFVDFNTGDHRKVLCLGDLDLSVLEKSALIGFHCFTGNDYVSSFFRKSKKTCWKVLRENPRLLQAFSELGTSWTPSNELQSKLEEFVCVLFGNRRIKKINEVRYLLYKAKFEKKEKVIDLSLLPPCWDSLQLHTFRANYVARRYRLSEEAIINEPRKELHGWFEDGQINWVKQAFPEDIELLLVEDGDMEESEDDVDVSGPPEYVEPGDESEGSDDEQP